MKIPFLSWFRAVSSVLRVSTRAEAPSRWGGAVAGYLVILGASVRDLLMGSLFSSRRLRGREGVMQVLREEDRSGNVMHHLRDPDLPPPLPAYHDVDLALGSELEVSKFECVQLFCKRLESVGVSYDQVAGLNELAAAVRMHMAKHDEEPVLRLGPASGLAGLLVSHVEVRLGKILPEQDSFALITPIAGIAETGTLMCVSDPQTPTGHLFFPPHLIAVLGQDQLYLYMDEVLPWFPAISKTSRTITWITGPARTGDIEQTMVRQAHGPFSVHVLLVPSLGTTVSFAQILGGKAASKPRSTKTTHRASHQVSGNAPGTPVSPV